MDDILNINNVYFDDMVSQIYPSELQLNKANSSDTEAAFLDLLLSISNDIVSTKFYDKRDDFDFEIVNFPNLDGYVPRSTSYGVYISQLIRFARASSYVAEFNTRNKLLIQKLHKQSYPYHKLRKTFSKFYRRSLCLVPHLKIFYVFVLSCVCYVCARLFICALWSPAGKGLTSWLSFVVSSVSLSLSHWYPGSGVVLDCIDS